MLSKPFNITNGTRQGCPLSPLIFALVMEPLAQLVRSSPEIRGVQVGDVENADNVILSLTSPQVSLSVTHRTIHRFSQVSYYKVNDTKSYILNVSAPPSLQTSLSQRFSYQCSKDSIKYLGNKIPPRLNALYTHNYLPWLTKLPLELGHLAKHELAMKSRLNTFKMMILPRQLYIFWTVPIPVPRQVHGSLPIDSES